MVSIFKILKTTGWVQVGWFNKWATGSFLLDADFQRVIGSIFRAGRTSEISGKSIKDTIEHYYKRYYGAPWKIWEQWALIGKSTKEIADILTIPEDAVTRVLSPFGGLNVLKRDVRKKVAIDLLAIGIDPRDIYTKTFKFGAERNFKFYFEDLFNMPYDKIINYNWAPHYKGWIEFYGLFQGIDY